MPNFSTPTPTTLDLDVAVGDIRITAADVTETSVEIRPTDPTNSRDVAAAEGTSLDRHGDQIVLRTPRQRAFGAFDTVGSIDVEAVVPTGSHLIGATAVATFRVDGQLGDCRVKSATGHLAFERVAAFDGSTSAGNISIDEVDGPAQISSSTGSVHVGLLGADGTVKASNGRVNIGRVRGDLVVKAANGDVNVGTAEGDVRVSTANGNLSVDELVRGNASFKTAYGRVAVGIRSGTATRLDVSSSFGRVSSALDGADGPGDATETLELHARTSFGNIDIHRA